MVTENQNIHLSLILEIICNRLQITKEQYSSAEEKYKAVGTWLGDSDSPLYYYQPDIFPQGSFRIGTTVKPLARDEYDIDLVCQFQKDNNITDPMGLLDAIYQRIKLNKTYSSIAEKKNRCVCINYQGNFHLDILPARSDFSLGPNCLLVPDQDTQGWKASNPKGYAEWFEEAARVRIELLEKARIEPLPRYETLSDKLPLQQTVQLLKRWRDIAFSNNDDFAPPSIVLTTLAGIKYKKELLITDALTTVITGILNEIDVTSESLVVLNPSNSKEYLSEKWVKDPKGYHLFVKLFKEFKQKWEELLQIKGISEISVRLERIFGEKIVKTAFKEYSQTFETARQGGKLGIEKKSGILTGLGSGVVPIKKNTFYGK